MKLGIFSQIPDSASAFYRAIFPFKALSKQMNFEFQVIDGSRETILKPNELFEFDVAFMMRPHDPGHYHLLSRVKQMGIPLWIDYDDDLFAIPFDHKEWEYFQSDSTRRSIVDTCLLADVITVTTERIKEVFIAKGIDNEKIVVIPNAINDYLHPEPTPHNELKSQTICWRGGFTHDRDLESIGPAIQILLKKGYRFIFLGHNPYAVETYLTGGEFTRIPFDQNIFSYFQTLQKINAPFHIVPLQDTPLNRAKSNLAYLEATWLGGSVVLAPEKFSSDSGCLGYENLDDLVECMTNEQVLRERKKAYDMAVKNIRENYLLSKVNVMRESILANLYSGYVLHKI